ncbi:MAG TPA: hypothetical protein VJ908_02065 [Wenzhouxiangellaceae bacterium]|nr:hypothetical protein [Wenzhouxiangellaceae bacterium]
MRKTMLAGLALTAVTVGCNMAMAQSGGDLSYSYLEGGVSIVEIDAVGISETETGFNVRASADLAGGVYVHGSWDRWEAGIRRPFINSDFDIDLYKFGLGYRFNLQPNTDLFVEGSYAAIEIGSTDDDGFRGDIGLRHGFNDRVEGRVFGGYQSDGDSGDGILGADLLFKFHRNFGLSLGVETYEFDLNIYRANLRLSF